MMSVYYLCIQKNEILKERNIFSVILKVMLNGKRITHSVNKIKP